MLQGKRQSHWHSTASLCLGSPTPSLRLFTSLMLGSLSSSQHSCYGAHSCRSLLTEEGQVLLDWDEEQQLQRR